MNDPDLPPPVVPTPPPVTPGRSEAPDSNERTWAMLCHLAALGGYILPAGNIIGPLLVWNIKKDEYPLVAREGRASVNFQISMTIWIIIALLLCFACIGFPVVVALALTDLICIIVAAVQASCGRSFTYPLTIRFIK